MYYKNNTEKRVAKMRKIINVALQKARDCEVKDSKPYQEYNDTIKLFNEYTFW